MSPVSSHPFRPASRLSRTMFTITGLGLVGLTLACVGSTRSNAGTQNTPASPSPKAASGYTDWKVRPDGAGPVKVGMTLDEVAKATHAAVRTFGPPAAEEGGCFYVSIEGGPEGLPSW